MKYYFSSLVLLLGLVWFSADAVAGASLTTTSVEAAGTDWTAAIWKTNGTGTAVSPVSGNTYTAISNGVSIGNGTSNTRIRNPANSGVQTFPGDSLTLNTNSELRAKQPGATLNFPGVSGNPGLILNGGMLNGGDDAIFPVTGVIKVAGQSYISHGANGGGGGISPNRAFKISGILTGSNNIVIINSGTTFPQQIAGNSNTFTGQWIVQCGWLQGSGFNSLGTNSITVDPNYTGYLAAMPNASSPIGPAWIEPDYDLNSAGALILTNGAVMILHQNCVFSSVKIEGVSLSAGTHYYPELAANFPVNFASGGSGSLTVQPFGSPPLFAPTIGVQPMSTTLNAGTAAQLFAGVSGATPLVYQWQKGTNGIYVSATDTGDVSGSKTNVLNFGALAAADAADYRLIVTNAGGAVTSQVATVTVIVPDSTKPKVASLSPAAGSTINAFSQLQVNFSENVVGVDASDLLINGIPANTVSGSGSNYVFNFSQPLAGTILVYWDVDSGITDNSGNYFDTSISWTYTLVDNIPPTVVSTVPTGGAIVSQLTQAQVNFSEAVTNVVAGDLLINGAPATGVTGSGAGPYVFQFVSPAQGTVQLAWAAGNTIADISPMGNRFAGGSWTVRLDTANADAALTNVVINEFLASNVNTNGLRDEDSELDDWIEIYNRGNTSVNLAGWSLTDAADQPGEWIFPATNIAAGQYMVIFASGKNRTVPGANLHTSFSLSTSPGYLGLYNADYPPRVAYEYAPSYPQQHSDDSYGINNVNGLSYFAVQTPGGPNSANTLNGLVDDVHFTVPHGFFSQPFNLLLTTATPGATIVYTTNGSAPSISGGTTNGIIYAGPLAINQTTALRAAAFAPGLLPSVVGSQTYLFVESIIRQPNNPPGYPTGNVWTPTPSQVVNGSRAYYEMDPTIVNDPQYTNAVRAGLTALPTLSIMTSIDDMFGPANGIYTHTSDATSDSYRGPLWERDCSMELIYPDGSSGGIQLDCGIEIQGGSQRDPAKNAKHSFRLKFTSQYGPGKLNFPFYPDSPVQSFNTLVVDSGINYWWHYVGGSVPEDQRYRAQCVRDQFTSDLMLALGHPSFHGKFVHLYLNGLYWGIQYLHERPDDDFAASYFGGANTDYDVLKNTTFGLELLSGDANAWNTALALSNTGLTNNAQYEQLQQYVDVDNLIDYMIVNHWAGNDDWPQHNWYVIRNRNTTDGFKFIVWDAEHVLKSVTENVTTVNADGSPAQIYLALANNAEFRLRYADHLQKLFFNGGLFYINPTNSFWDPAHPQNNLAASYYMKRITEITNAIVDESARWGGYLLTTNYTRNNHWLRELNNLLGFATNAPLNTTNYFPIRSANVLNQYRAIGLFPNVSAPVFSQQGGNVPVGFGLTMTNLNSSGIIYYTTNGTDPRAYGSGSVSPSAFAYHNGTPLVLSGSTVVKARVLNGAWSALNEGDFGVALLGVPIRITELMYEPNGGSSFEFIELQNIGPTNVDMSGYSFGGVTYVFPNGTILAPGGVMVISSSGNPAAFAARYPGLVVAGMYGGSLSNSGQRVALLDQNGNTVIAVNYNNAAGWPVGAAGGGYSLEIINPNGDPDDPANWRASTAINGSPGIVTTVTASNNIRFNEIMAENDGAVTNGGTFPDWLELYNPSSNAVNIANWSLSNSGNARKYIFPGGTTLAAGGYLVVWCDSDTTAPGLHSGFNLSKNGENLFLYDASTNRVDAFSFGLQLANFSIGRVGAAGTWQLTFATPGAANLPALTGGATNLFINEWLANSPAGGSDWMELYNASNLPVALTGLYLGTSNELFEIRSVSFIPANGFVQLFADKLAGPDHLDFKLTAAGDAIVLYDYSGQQIDRVSFVNQLESVSEGRLPDGASNIVSFPGTASPDASNYVSTYSGPILNELMARNTSAVYDAFGNHPDWLELYNPGATSFDLSGMSLSVGQNQWVIPGGVSIIANGYLVIWCDNSRAASTSVETDLNTGFALPGDGSTVTLFNTNGQTVDSVAFGFQIANVSIGKIGGTWNLLSAPTPGAANSAAATLGNATALRINEWMANPVSGNDWFELYNPNAQPVSLGGLYLTDDPSITDMTQFLVPALSFIGGHGWVEYQADGHPSNGPNHTGFSLNKDGETIHLYNEDLSQIDEVDFGIQAEGVSQGRLPDGGSNLVSFVSTPTPDASNFLPLPNVLINEVLTHASLPFEDAIELYNFSSNSVAVGGWFISDVATNFGKYRIPDGTVLAAGGYQVFYQDQFDTTNSSPFVLDAVNGGNIFLSQADAQGNLSGYRAQVSFGAAENNVSFGRFVTSDSVDFVAMSNHTFGADSPATVAQFRTGTGLANAYPKVGPVVFNEIMYYPVTISGGVPTENVNEEYLELFNTTSDEVTLYDPVFAANCWKIDGDVQYTFPRGVTLPPGGYLLVVGFDPVNDSASLANFRTKYGITNNVAIYGPYKGSLDDGGATIELLKPGTPEMAPSPDAGFVPYVLVESVSYSSAGLWPGAAAGTGMSLQRRALGSYGNEPLNWIACNPNPGSRNCINDTDGDGLPDDWELAHGLNPYSAAGDDGANGDPDHDGLSNLQEYLAGTDPHDAQSVFKIAAVSVSPNSVNFQFTGVGGHSYIIQYSDSLASGVWQTLTNIPASATNTTVQVKDSPNTNGAVRFYRLVTPGGS
ncbi:MAG TPA: lamin tail domain-containing protein [Verrucomicrobiae bacterium]|jgi:hypothetical protein|nr:lamin tail domain-containing protein [Verrucomicrobiae bacterium]